MNLRLSPFAFEVTIDWEPASIVITCQSRRPGRACFPPIWLSLVCALNEPHARGFQFFLLSFPLSRVTRFPSRWNCKRTRKKWLMSNRWTGTIELCQVFAPIRGGCTTETNSITQWFPVIYANFSPLLSSSSLPYFLSFFEFEQFSFVRNFSMFFPPSSAIEIESR